MNQMELSAQGVPLAPVGSSEQNAGAPKVTVDDAPLLAMLAFSVRSAAVRIVNVVFSPVPEIMPFVPSRELMTGCNRSGICPVVVATRPAASALRGPWPERE